MPYSSPTHPSQQLLKGLFILMNGDSANTRLNQLKAQNLTIGFYQPISLNTITHNFPFLLPKIIADNFLLKSSVDDLVIQGPCSHLGTQTLCDPALLEALSVQLDDEKREHRKDTGTSYHFAPEMTCFCLTPLSRPPTNCHLDVRVAEMCAFQSPPCRLSLPAMSLGRLFFGIIRKCETTWAHSRTH